MREPAECAYESTGENLPMGKIAAVIGALHDEFGLLLHAGGGWPVAGVAQE